MVSEDRITIPNHHVAACGKLPDWAREREPGSCFGYYENELGEQWVFKATRAYAQLAGGDAGWSQVFRIENPDWSAVDEWMFGKVDLEANALNPGWPGVVLDALEAAWLRTVVLTAGRRFTMGKRSRGGA